MIRINWKHLAVTLAVLPLAAVLFAWIGFFNVGASTGHWKITDWFLHFAMRSAVRTYALAVDEPERLPVEAIKPAAGHFARGCAICHGAPGEPRSPATLKMLPLPPDLASVAGEWEDAELFRIVKHGVRFTGMPAWPTQNRDDEVWAMVAFLRTLPDLEAGAYRQLAYGEAGAPELHTTSFGEAVAECSRCHGEDGAGGGPATPLIAGQSEAYLAASLRAFAEGRRASGFMALPAAAVDQADIDALAKHFAELPSVWEDGGQEAPEESLARGERIARAGVVREGVPACLGCHGEDRNPLYPHIRGQRQDYLAQQLLLFRAGQRGGGPFSHLMTHAANGLQERDIVDLAAYFSVQTTPDPQ